MSIRMPWRLKILAKLALSRANVPYPVWARLNLFRHGSMDSVDYARSVFSAHFERSGLSHAGENEFVCLELGPGDSLLSAVFARSYGSKLTYLIDVAPFAVQNLRLYSEAGKDLATVSRPPLSWQTWKSMDAMLADCSAKYLTHGLESLREVPVSSVDWSWSNAVLEHVRRSDFTATIRELRRVLKPGGVTSHRIDFQDHLGGALNNLRFSEKRWESEFFAKGGFYTNRLRYTEIVETFVSAGFRLESAEPSFWAELPTAKDKLHTPFRNLPDDELKIRWADLVFRAV